MSATIKSESTSKAVVSVSSMCRQLSMSRSQFYFHVKRGTFHAPNYLASNNRPYFTITMVEDNVRARETGLGVNGEYVLFYERHANTSASVAVKPTLNINELLDGLKASGLKNVTRELAEPAIHACFPNGTNEQGENAILTAVFRYLKRSGTV